MADNIQQYTAKGPVFRPSETGIEATAQMARRIGAFYNQVAQDRKDVGHELGSGITSAGTAVADYEAHREIVHGALGLAGLHTGLTDDWNQTAKSTDPNDPSVAAKWKQEKLEPALEQFQNGFRTEKGQKWAEQRIEAFRSHFDTKTSADMSTRSGIAVTQNIRQLTNSYSTTAQKDPTSTFEAMSHIDASFDAIVDSAPNLTPDKAAELKEHLKQTAKEQIAKAGVYGAIQANPNKGLEMASDARLAPYVNGMEVKQFETYARGEQRMQMTQRRQEEMERRRQVSDAAHEQAGQTLANTTEVDPQTGTLRFQGPDGAAKFTQTIRDLSARGGPTGLALAHSMWTMFSQLEHQKPPAIDDGATAAKLMEDIGDGRGSLKQIIDAKNGRQISDHTYNEAIGLYQKVKADGPQKFVDQAAYSGVKAQLVVPMAYAKFVQEFLPQVHGMSPDDRAKAMDTRNPNSLINTTMRKYEPNEQEKFIWRAMHNSEIGATTSPLVPARTPIQEARPFPERPAGVPPNAQYNFKTNQWRDPDTKKIFDNGPAVPESH